ncbi:MAG: TonB-dependent receptor [Bacteroidota bacterium]
MLNKIFFACALLMIVSSIDLQAQYQFTALVLDEESEEPLIGATIHNKKLGIGAVTDTTGKAVITDIPEGKHQFKISYVGYEILSFELVFPAKEQTDVMTYKLHPKHDEMEEVTISSTRSSRTIDNIPTRVEFIAGEELTEKGNMKPGDIRMLLNESTGIRTQQTSATSYNSSIRIQGLDGKYTQLLRDGLPLFSGYSGSLSLMQIAPLDLKQVEVIKGANSTLYGGGAIAGLVNLISKDPKSEPELSMMFNGTSALGLDVSSFYANRNEKIGTTIFASYNKGTAYDPAGIGLTAIPEFDRFTLNPKLFIYPREETKIEIGLNMVKEERLGGNIDYINGEDVNNPYFELNETDRVSSQVIVDHSFEDNFKASFKNSFSYFDRRIEIPDYNFSGLQFSSFSELNFNFVKDNSEWIGGLNLWTDNFDQSLDSMAFNHSFQEYTTGVFLQNTYDFTKNIAVESGLRLDYNNQYGFFPLPRLSLMYTPTNSLTFRMGGGLGYKTPTVFSEEAETLQFQSVRPLNRSELSAERSYGANFDINYSYSFTEKLSLTSNALFFYTQIENPLNLVPVQNQFEFIQSAGYVDSKGIELNLKWGYEDFKLFTGYTFADVNETVNNSTDQMPLVAKHRLNNVLMYEKHGNFWLGLEAYYFSPQRLNDGEMGQSYWIFGLMSEKRFSKMFSVFLNFENFTDTRQTAFDTVYRGNIENPQFRDIYAPVDGFVINGGIKLNLL